MSEFEKIKTISARINHLLETVGRNAGKFSVIDKDMLSNYVRELYELIVEIEPGKSASNLNELSNKREINSEEPVTKDKEAEEDFHADKIEQESPAVMKNDAARKSISEIYSQKDGNGKVTVNDRFKRQSKEVADHLKQTPIKDLKAYIGLNKRFAFINTLFNGDEEKYDSAISRVNEFKSYEDAANFIQSDILKSFDWKDDEPLVAEFFTLVMRRYLN